MPCCEKNSTPRKINLQTKETEKTKTEQQQGGTLRVAVGGMVTPEAAFGYYRQFLDYLGDNLRMHVVYVDREDYSVINELVRKGNVDVAFVCGGPYVDGHDSFGMELLAAPSAYGGTVYYSYIIVGKDSPLSSFEDLRGKRFAFTDPLSNTGSLVPTFMLSRMHETPESFFQKYVYLQSHDKAIMAVAAGLVDGAAVDSLVWEYLDRTHSEFTSRTKVILKSPPYGIPPVVVRPGLDPNLKNKLRDVFLNAHKSEKGRAILDGMMIDRFVPIQDSAYDSIREMKRWVAEHSRKATGR